MRLAAPYRGAQNGAGRSCLAVMVIIVVSGVAGVGFAPQADRTASFHLHLLRHDIGRESDTRSSEGGRQQVQSTFHFDDRGAAEGALWGTETCPRRR
jgi:hypothetical protein